LHGVFEVVLDINDRSIVGPFAVVKRRLYTQRRRVLLTWVHDQIFAAGGEHIPSTWQAFAGQTGVDAVMHMRPDHPAEFHGPPPEVFLWLDVEDEAQAGFVERQLAGEFLMDMLAQGRRVLLHSSLGRHRTRWAFVAYCICAGQSVRAALRRAADRPWLSPYHTDGDAWQAFEIAMRASRIAHSSAQGPAAVGGHHAVR
jgi:hypothetical protein